jgi:hypothetical protein
LRRWPMWRPFPESLCINEKVNHFSLPALKVIG